jgi:hypothetical protein
MNLYGHKYIIIDLAKGDGVVRGVEIIWQPSKYLMHVHADVIFGGE